MTNKLNKTLDQKNKERTIKRLERLRIECKLAINAMPATRIVLQKLISASRSHVNRVINHLRENQKIHIGGYAKTQSAHAPVYVAGAGVDADYPTKQPKVRPAKPVKPVPEPFVFKLPPRCEPKTRVAMPDSPYKTKWVTGVRIG